MSWDQAGKQRKTGFLDLCIHSPEHLFCYGFIQLSGARITSWFTHTYQFHDPQIVLIDEVHMPPHAENFSCFLWGSSRQSAVLPCRRDVRRGWFRKSRWPLQWCSWSAACFYLHHMQSFSGYLCYDTLKSTAGEGEGRSVKGLAIFPACHFFAQKHPSPEAKAKQSSRIPRESGVRKFEEMGDIWKLNPVLLALIPLPFRSCIPSKEDERCTIVPCNGGPPHWIPGKGQPERTRNPAKKIHLGIGVVLRNI